MSTDFLRSDEATRRARAPKILALNLFLLIAIFALDLATPLVGAVWLLYLVPLFLAYMFSEMWYLVAFAAASTVLTVLGFFYSPPGIQERIAIFNRSLGIGVFATATFILWQRKRIKAVLARQVEALRESETLLRAVLEHSPAIIFLKDTQGRYLLCNREFEKISHASSEAVIGKTDEDLFSPEQAASFHAHDRKVLETGVPLAFEEVALHDDGPHTSIVHKFPLRDAAGKTYAIGGIVIDITPRKRMEELLRALSLITEKLNSTLDMETLLDELVREAMRLINAEGGCAGLRIPQGMACNKYFQGSEILPLEYCWSPGHGLPGWVLKYKVPYLTNDVPRDQQFLHTLWDKFGVRSALSVPILDNQREVLGFFQLHNKRGRSGFTPSDQTTLMLVAQAASSAIQRTMAFQSIQLAEKSLRESEERFRSVVESATDAIVQADQRGHILSLNKAALRFFGYTAEELLGKPLTILMPARYQAAHQQGLERLRTTGESSVIGRPVELHGLRKDGSEFPLELSLGTWKANGENFFSGIMRDITAQKVMQQQEEYLRRFVEGVKDYAIFKVTPQGLVDSWNVGAERIKGYPAEEILGRHFSRFYLPEDIQAGKPEVALKMAAAEGRCEEAGWRVRKDGSTFWAQAIITAVRDDAGLLRGFLKITQDLTEQRMAQQSLEYSFDQLRTLSRRLENVREDERTRIAQEIHDELGGTLSYLKLDLMKLHAMVPSVSNREASSALRKTIASMIQLLDNTISTVQRIATEIRPGVLDDFGLVAAVEWLARDFQKRSGITCTFRSEIDDVQVEREPATALFRICQEALTNVVRHAHADRVAIRLAKTADQLLLEIKDNGKGVPEAKIAHSLSLGLVGMRERTARLGGEFQIRGIPKKGTTITASVPLTGPKTEENMAARDVRGPGERRSPGERIGGI